jgi:TIR domain-containing protein
MGFKVWCDLAKLIGGEPFWDNAEDGIRNSAAKFLYVLSRTSNTKGGVLRELQLAHALAKSKSLENFVVHLSPYRYGSRPALGAVLKL